MRISPALFLLAFGCAPPPNPDCAEVGWADVDGDGWGDPDAPVGLCDDPTAGVSNDADCDDSTSQVGPDADERCNGIDDDCDGSIDEDAIDAQPFFSDQDRDGLGRGSAGTLSCEQPPDTSDRGGDCDDTDPAVGAALLLHLDLDQDGFGDAAVAETRCPEPLWVADDTDCNDSEPTVYPGAAALCDGLDNDCDDALEEDAVVPDDGELQVVIDASADASWICLRPGAYEPITLVDRAVTLEGTDAGTVISGSRGRRPVTVVGGAVDLVGLTLAGGDIDGGGGGLRLEGGPHTLTDVEIAFNTATASGGGLYAQSAEVTLTRVHVRDNRAPSGAGILISNVDLTARQLRTTRNLASGGSSSHQGGGLASILANDVDIAGWISVDDGIDDDRSGSVARGGALYLQGSGVVRNSIFVGSRAQASSIRGAAVHLDRGVTLDNVTVHDVGCPGVGASPPDESCGIHAGPDTQVRNVTISGVVGPRAAMFASGATVQGLNVYDVSVGAAASGSDPFSFTEDDPAFVEVSGEDRSTWDLHLDEGSPLIDAGVDLGADPDGSPTDVGAYGGPGATDLQEEMP